MEPPWSMGGRRGAAKPAAAAPQQQHQGVAVLSHAEAAAAAAQLLPEGGARTSGAAGGSYARPAKRARPAGAPVRGAVDDDAAATGDKRFYGSAEERLRAASTCADLWPRPGEAPVATPAPERYGGLAHYVSVLEPLVFAEAREELLSELDGALDAGKFLPVMLTSVRGDGGGGAWHVATLELQGGPGGRPPPPPAPKWMSEGVAVVLSDCHPSALRRRIGGAPVAGEDAEAAAAEAEEAEAEEGEVDAVKFAGFVRFTPGSSGRREDAFTMRFYMPGLSQCEELADTGAASARARALATTPAEVARGAAAATAFRRPRATWWVSYAGRLTTTVTEFKALHGMQSCVPSLRAALLSPPPAPQLPDYELSVPPTLAPEVGLKPAFVAHLHDAFNEPQRRAICWAAAAAADASAEAVGVFHPQPAVGPDGAGAAAAWPFTLVQGPPGTGKTHTVWGILNVMHMTAYQRYYRTLLHALAPTSAAVAEAEAAAAVAEAAAAAAAAASATVDGDAADEALAFSEDEVGESDADSDESAGLLGDTPAARAAARSGFAAVLAAMRSGSASAAAGEAGFTRTLATLSRKPRILVCAPSNAATDTLLNRVMEKGFVQSNGHIYRPDVARVASAASVDRSEDPSKIRLSEPVRAVSVGHRAEELMRMEDSRRQHWATMHRSNAHAMNERRNYLRALAERAAAAGDAATRDSAVTELVRVTEDLDRTIVDLNRLELLAAWRRGEYADHMVRNAIETSFTDEAEIVFTTLASAGRAVFGRLSHGFDMVLIDEAAQATEVALLTALRLGARRAVLVGDPQQLRATVLSSVAKDGLFQRSLFERLVACGVRSLMLTRQFRMHPAIRQWPSLYFYQGRLEDAPSIAAAPPEPFYATFPLLPYAVFDVAEGQEARGPSGSVRNEAEAVLAACLYRRLREELAPAPMEGRVAVVTPYREQTKCIAAAFARICGVVCGATEDAGVKVNTIDAFQGQERDVVIFSAVRTGRAGPVRQALGFVTDVRRLNVGLTRARRALWVLGAADALRRDPAWGALLEDAEARAALVPGTSAAALFPQYGAAALVTQPPQPRGGGSRAAARAVQEEPAPPLALSTSGMGWGVRKRAAAAQGHDNAVAAVTGDAAAPTARGAGAIATLVEPEAKVAAGGDDAAARREAAAKQSEVIDLTGD